jgi:hypothetical protein
MAKYVKTEEGYKPINEIEGGASLIADKYLQIKDGIIRTTFGDPIVAEEGKESQVFSSNIPAMEYWPSLNGYTTSPLGTMGALKFPNVGDIFKVELQHPNGQTIIFDNVEYTKSKYLKCNDDIRILLSAEYQSIEGFGNIVFIASSNLTGGKLKILRKTEGYITLPKTALNYDDAPTENSVNLLTSGTIYERLKNLSNTIQELREKINALEKAQATTLSDYQTSSDLIGGAE